MFDIGFTELVLIGLIALIVLGPKRLPEAARTAGRWVRTVRGFVSSVKHDLAKELQAEDLKEFKRLHEELAEARSTLRESASKLTSELNEQVDLDHKSAASKSSASSSLPSDADGSPSNPTESTLTSAGTGHGDAESNRNG